MKVCATCRVEKPLDEFHRKADARDGRAPHCKACKKAIDTAYREANLEELRAYDRERGQRPERREPARKRLKARYEANKAEHLEQSRQYNKAHPEQVRENKRAYKRRNPAKTLAATRKRQARLLNAAPAWANQFFIEEIYDLARRRTEATGIEWQVDHIVPLQHPLVQGLHCEANLQVIPAVVNYAKSNRHWPDMPC